MVFINNKYSWINKILYNYFIISLFIFNIIFIVRIKEYEGKEGWKIVKFWELRSLLW